MSTEHPVAALRSKLETIRTEAVEKLAAKGDVSQEGLRNLAEIQSALTAVRETLSEHSARVGWSGDEAAIEEAAVNLEKR
jgi:ElaB/YqjD/DUF883 family membrane-anchored ribosome-binding protein